MTVRFADGAEFEIDGIGVSPINRQLYIGIHRMAFAEALQLVSDVTRLSEIVWNDGKQDVETYTGYTNVVGILADVTGSLQIWLARSVAE